MVVSILLFFVAFAVYLPRVSPSLYGGDCGEFIASACVLGIPHAPGFPTYNLLGKMAQTAIPFGHDAYRTNVLAALAAAGVLVLLWHLLEKVLFPSSKKIMGFVGVVALGLSPIFWEQALAIEVFGLNLFFLIGIIICLNMSRRKAEREGDRRYLWLAALLFGLGLGNHQILIVVFPLMAYFFWTSPDRERTTLGGVAFCLLGLAVNLYLPIRARMNPPVNFGDPETLSRLWAVLTRKEFGSLSLHPAAVTFMDGELFHLQMLAFCRRAWFQMGMTGAILALFGAGAGLLNKDTRRLALLSLAGWLLVGLGFELASNLSPGSAIGQWRLERFYLIPLFSLVVLLVLGVSEGFRRNRWIRYAVTGLVVLFLFEKGWGLIAQANLRRNVVFRDFAESLLRLAPQNADLVIDRVMFDEPTSSILVATQVEGKRPDIRFFYRPGTLFSAIYGEDVLTLSWSRRAKRQNEVEKNLLGKGRDTAFLGFEKNNAPFPRPRQHGLLYRPDGAGAGETERLFSHLIVNRTCLQPDHPDYPSRLMSVHFPYFAGKGLLEEGQEARAGAWLRKARYIGSDMAWLSSNIGGLYAQRNDIPVAEAHYQRVVRQDPYFPQGHLGLGFTGIKQGRFEEAETAYEKAVRLSPFDPDGYYMLGVARTYAGKHDSARDAWKKYLELAPHGPQADIVREHLK